MSDSVLFAELCMHGVWVCGVSGWVGVWVCGCVGCMEVWGVLVCGCVMCGLVGIYVGGVVYRCVGVCMRLCGCVGVCSE